MSWHEASHQSWLHLFSIGHIILLLNLLEFSTYVLYVFVLRFQLFLLSNVVRYHFSVYLFDVLFIQTYLRLATPGTLND